MTVIVTNRYLNEVLKNHNGFAQEKDRAAVPTHVVSAQSPHSNKTIETWFSHLTTGWTPSVTYIRHLKYTMGGAGRELQKKE